ncbi:MlaD family protein [Psychroserpens sp.]|uniref:MlaD family protein n=1 Tax=Psychroserpens sp. TaxID=2020870 RepID=UPI001B2C1AFB|nr:MlaD family protein [Psychroserpens sp.]MBO6607483.1 MCE family protein [Psychroserpens sp.]MBO6654439.1 MCE family protein [Psychroserpens sp.]MBO6681212.1 MCE family protein [Psychroserpens sp.]MBO6749831.1 MCE family protein [Psychroserpens sp.]MBO6916181.1 MCE family protein [Psychroserpens sp.]
MKRTNKQKIRLGLFVTLGTIIFVVAVYLIGQRQNMFNKTFTISSYFQNVNGLQRGNNVRYSGIDIGTVKDIIMINDSTIQVDMNIQEKIITHIKKNAIATIGSDGLVGNMIVNIVPGKGPSELINNGDVIESYSKIGADDILSTLSVGSENAAILTADLLKITSAMLEGEGTVGLLLNDTIMAQDLKRSVRNLKLASQGATNTINELNAIISSLKTNDETVLGMILNDTLSGEKLKLVVSNLESSSREIETVLDNVNGIMNDIKTSEGAYNYIVKDTALVNSLRSTLDNINEGTAKFNENMEALKHNFLFRGYFKKLERQAKREERKNN